jgi:YesN/AraC family two-component response regulator
MPIIDGIGVMQKINESNLDKKPEIMILSGVSQEKMTKDAINLGASCFLLKPFDLEMLAKRIKDVVGEQEVKIKTDNNCILDENITENMDLEKLVVINKKQYNDINNAIEKMYKRGQLLPNEIYLTSLLEFGDDGEFVKKYMDKIFINVRSILANPTKILQLISHESAHMADFKLSDNRLFSLPDRKHCQINKTAKTIETKTNKVSLKDVKDYIGYYACTKTSEFVAEISKLIMSNIIGLDKEGNYTIKKDADGLYKSDDDTIIENYDAEKLNNIMNLYIELTEGKIISPEVII